MSMPFTSNRAPATPRSRWPRIKWRQQIIAYAFLLPALIAFAIFAWWPILNSIIMSFQQVNLMDASASTWVGLRNFERMLADPTFAASWRNSLEFTLLSIVIGFFVPVFVAILVNEMRVAGGFFRIVYFLPSVIPPLIAILVWKLIYSPQPGGLLNQVVIGLGGIRQGWLQDPALVKPSILVIMTWGGFGSTMLIYLAMLQDLPVELYEAAEIDGATPLHRIRHITLPYLRSTMLVLLIVQVLGLVQIFIEPLVLTQGGPGQATMTPVFTLYRKGFLNGDYGLAAAWSVLLMAVLGVLSMIYLWATRSRER
ncbi:MAG TPA: sugar ABC transporter permease [Aggregatilineales bacterium]|nr:sugar ABC transporter permease [Aggregatilineales bacterium]